MATCKTPDFKCRPLPRYMCNFQELADAINAGGLDVELVQTCMKAVTAGTGFSIGDIVTRNIFYDVTVDPAVIVSTGYYNETTGLELVPANVEAGTFEDCTIDREAKCSCLVDSAGDQFQRLYWLDAINESIVGTTDVDFDGAPFTPAAGAVTPCGGNDEDVEPLCMTDDNGQFIRHVVYLGGAILDSFDTLSDGLTGYTAVGTVTACEPCKEWVEVLCDTTAEILSIDGLSVATPSTVEKVDLLTGAILDTHTNPNALVPSGAYDATLELYYVYSSVSDEWFSYDANNMAAGATNLGTFAGVTPSANMNWGAIDPTTSLGHFGTNYSEAYIVDFTAQTVSNTTLIAQPNPTVDILGAVAINPNGEAFMLPFDSGVGTTFEFYRVDLDTGSSVLLQGTPPIVFTPNGLGTVTDEVTGAFLGWVSVDRVSGGFYFWQNEDMSDLQFVGTATLGAGGTIDGVGAIVVGTSVTFQRCFSSCNGVVTSVDLDMEGNAYTVVGVVQLCSQEVTTVIEQFETEQVILCDVVSTTGDLVPAGFVNISGAFYQITDVDTGALLYTPTAVAPYTLERIIIDPATPTRIYAFEGSGGNNVVNIGDGYGYFDTVTDTWVDLGVTSGTAFGNIRGLAYNPADGVWYATTPSLAPEGIFTFNPTTGVFTDTGVQFDTFPGAGTYGITFDDAGNVYHVPNNGVRKGSIATGVTAALGALVAAGTQDLYWYNGSLYFSADDDFYDDTTGLVNGTLVSATTRVLGVDYFGGLPIAGTVTKTEFVRHTIYDQTTGLEVSTFDTELDMETAYVPTGTVELCSSDSQSDVEQFCMQDDVGKFIRHFTYTDGLVTGYFDTDVEGADYTVTGTAVQCGASTVTLATAAYINPIGVNTYSLPANINSITITALSVTTGITINTGAGTVPLLTGQSISFSAPDGEVLDSTTFDVVTGASDSVAISTVALS